MRSILAIRHFAFVVSDLDRSLDFYQNILGLELYRRFTEKGDFIDSLTGLNNVNVEWAKLVIPQGGLIELLQYHSHPDKNFFNSKDAPSNKMGASHVALTVENLDKLFLKITDAGFTTKSPVLFSPNRKAKILYAHDPDGSILELIEDI